MLSLLFTPICLSKADLFRIALIERSPPFSYMQDGRPAGVSVDIFKQIMHRMNRELEVILLPYPRVTRAFQSSDVDLIPVYSVLGFDGGSKLQKSAQKSPAIWHYPLYYYATKDSQIKITDPKDMANYRIGYLRFGSGDELNHVIEDKVTYYTALEWMLRSLRAGRIDLAGVSPDVFLGLNSTYANEFIPVYQYATLEVSFAISPRESAESTQVLCKELTESYNSLLSDGVIESILISHDVPSLLPYFEAAAVDATSCELISSAE
jgi:ABC-type amino acid transport substrate-binding protein